jgi:hypothetical protein
LKWIGKGVLLVGKRIIKYGEDIPSGIHKDRLRRLKEQKCIGTIIEPVAPERANNSDKSPTKS